MKLSLPVKPKSIKQAALMADYCLLYYDRAFFLVDKPPDMACQMSYSTSAKYERYNILCKGLQHKLTMRHPPFAVRWMNKDTTGALLLATTKTWSQMLSDKFAQGHIPRTYLALVYGGREKFRETSGLINTGLSSLGGRVHLNPDGKEARTEWEVLGSSPTVPLTLLRLKFLTGDEHQLRVHLAECLNAPVVGDHFHAKGLPIEEIKAVETIVAARNKTFLHSSEISLRRYMKFSDPDKSFTLAFRAPVPLPFRIVCEEAQIPVDMQYLKQGRIFLNGEPWHESNYVHIESEKCWVSPKLREKSRFLEDSENAYFNHNPSSGKKDP